MSKEKDLYLTEEGLEEVKKELEELKNKVDCIIDLSVV